MNKKLVSVVVPFVNHREFIETCWINLQRQSYPEIELIFVNNGSADGSDEIAGRLAAAHPGKIRLVQELQKGIPFARNKGLREAHGEFISFLDVDDRFTSDKIERLQFALEQHPEAAMAFGQTLRIYTNTGRKIIQDTGKAKPGLNYPPALANDWTTSFYHLPQTGATLTRTAMAKTIGGFPENLLLGNDDVGFHIHLALNFPIVFEPFVAVEYFRHEKSEGARLNENKSVHARYFDAHLKVTEPAGKTYYQSTGKMQLWGLAQRGLFLNYLEGFVKKNNFQFTEELRQRLFGFYKFILPLYRLLPFKIAHAVYKILRRFMNLLSPSKYPLS